MQDWCHVHLSVRSSPDLDRRSSELELALQAAERETVVRARSVRPQGLQVLWRTVAHVLGPAVERVPRVQPPHEPIAADLCDDGRAGDRVHGQVSADDGVVVPIQPADGEAVHDDVLRWARKRGERA